MPIFRRTLADGSDDELIREEPLLIAAGGAEVLTMRTPGRDEDLALGFLLSEGVIPSAAAVTGMHATPGDPAARTPDRIDVALTGVDAAHVRGRLTRTHEIRTSCGACGLTDVDTLLEGAPPCLAGVPKVTHALLQRLRADFEARQELFARTGACHGAALYDGHGTLLGFAEDVGRHNALDKAIGQAARGGAALRRAIALLSGRAGYDLVLKCLRLGVPVILSVSAPSALGFDLCHAAGATLVGFLRQDRAKVYTGAERITG
ncbi:MAG TPA: formate dehydrogenase accessory sulfurtransferase FdhD [Planctomycetota bacterium]|nr:formate dehydrogenase accessory sulfurtransferase FdhD [Planctomycetota bacterium]